MINPLLQEHTTRWRRLTSRSGQSIVELAIAMPILLGLVIGIFEFGRAWNVRQVTTNAAREGARLSVIPGADPLEVEAKVNGRMTDAGLDPGLATVTITNIAGNVGDETSVQVDYPFAFTFIGPIVDLMGGGGTIPGSINMTTTSTMRHE